MGVSKDLQIFVTADSEGGVYVRHLIDGSYLAHWQLPGSPERVVLSKHGYFVFRVKGLILSYSCNGERVCERAVRGLSKLELDAS